MEEIWKDIDEFKGLYQVSNLGRIRSLDRTVKGRLAPQKIKAKTLKLQKSSGGYIFVNLCRDGKRCSRFIHRLIALSFVPNDDPANKIEVNHRDENILNNSIENLEWVTSKENANYGTRNIRAIQTRINNGTNVKGVVQLSLEHSFIAEYPTIAEASKTLNITDSPIIRVCKGKQNTSCGFKWMYSEDYYKQKIA